MLEFITLKIILAACATIWLLVCMLLYRVSRNTAWLAGSTVASCLVCLGATVLASVLVTGALFLVPLWLGVLALSGLHLHAAQQNTARMETIPGAIPNRQTTLAPPPTGRTDDSYI